MREFSFLPSSGRVSEFTQPTFHSIPLLIQNWVCIVQGPLDEFEKASRLRYSHNRKCMMPRNITVMWMEGKPSYINRSPARPHRRAACRSIPT